MKIAWIVLLALLMAACAEGPSPRQKYGEMYGVTGTNVPKKGDDPAPREVSIYGRETLQQMQSSGGSASRAADPNSPR